MIQIRTLALMIVAIIAPVSRNAARPEKIWQAAYAATPTNTATRMPTTRSLLPNSRQIES
ncbi:hypothetical protein D3C81_1547110 [compost metagenome]